MEAIKCTVEEFDNVKEEFNEVDHFTIRKGKAKYNIIHLPNNSCGIYYALRIVDREGIVARRAMEPMTEITVQGIK